MPQPDARHIWHALLDLVYPLRCAACDRIGEGYFCDACRAAIHSVPAPYCPKCHEPDEPEVCPGCRANPPAFSVARSAGLFEGPLRPAIHALKYERNEYIAPPLAGVMAQAFQVYEELADVEAVLPLPIHQKRERERGFNQSALLGRELSHRLGLPIWEDTLVREAYRRPQVGLGREERRENVRGVFVVSEKERVAGRTLLLLDDVLTTGATCHEAALALREAGAAEVRVLTLAREPYRKEKVTQKV